MKFDLTDISLEELSVVDKPANEMAKVAIFKREEDDMADVEKMTDDEMKKMGMTPDQMKKMRDMLDKGMSRDDAMKKMGLKKADETDVEKVKAEKDELQKNLDEMKTFVEGVKKALNDNGFDVKDDGTVQKRQEPEYVNVGGEKIEKGSVPESVLKRIEELEKREEQDRFEKMANETLPNMKGTPEVRARIIKNFHEDAEIMEILRAADALFKDQFSEFGKSTADADSSDPSDKLNNLAKAHAEANGVSHYVAYDEVLKTEEGRNLYNEIRKFN